MTVGLDRFRLKFPKVFNKISFLTAAGNVLLGLSEFVRTLRSSVLVVFNNFLLIDATDRSKISSDQKRFFIALSLYPLSVFANTSFKQDLLLFGNEKS